MAQELGSEAGLLGDSLLVDYSNCFDAKQNKAKLKTDQVA
jgi:hypothetical protein